MIVDNHNLSHHKLSRQNGLSTGDFRPDLPEVAHTPDRPVCHRQPDSTVQQEPAQGPSQSEPPCLAPSASTLRVQGFSGQVAEQIEAPQRG